MTKYLTPLCVVSGMEHSSGGSVQENVNGRGYGVKRILKEYFFILKILRFHEIFLRNIQTI